MILESESGRQAMEIGNTIVKSNSWHDKQVNEMKKILEKKLEKCQLFVEALKRSEGKKIVEDTGHLFWGRCNAQKQGKNIMWNVLVELSKKSL